MFSKQTWELGIIHICKNNLYLQVMSTTTGVLLNNAMANFAIPNENEDSSNTSNQMVEGRRPLTSNLVSLIMDTKDICGYRIVTGGASTSSVGQVCVHI